MSSTTICHMKDKREDEKEKLKEKIEKGEMMEFT